MPPIANWIAVAAIYAPTPAAQRFIGQAQALLEDAGIGLSITPLGSAYADLPA